MLVEYSKSRLVQLEKHVQLLNKMASPEAQQVADITKAVKVALSEIKTQLINNPPEEPEEIEFFKYVKPKFTALYLYRLEVFKIESEKPLTDEDAIMLFYNQELRYIRQFLDKHKFLYQYYRLGGTELDASYFLRGKENQSLFVVSLTDADPTFSTPCDHLFAQFIAYEQLQRFLIHKLSSKHDGWVRPGAPNSKVFKWTGDKSNLIEFAYGIYDALQINDGEVSIAEIISWLETSFDINLSRHYQIFSEIKNRKSVSRTRFLDHAREMLLQHMEEGDAFIPKTPKSVSGSKSTLKK